MNDPCDMPFCAHEAVEWVRVHDVGGRWPESRHLCPHHARMARSLRARIADGVRPEGLPEEVTPEEVGVAREVLREQLRWAPEGTLYRALQEHFDGREFTSAEVGEHVERPPPGVRDLLRELEGAGYLRRVRRGVYVGPERGAA